MEMLRNKAPMHENQICAHVSMFLTNLKVICHPKTIKQKTKEPSVDTLKTIITTIKISVLSINTSNADKVDLPQPLVPHNSTVTDSFLSRILHRENIIIA
jgi:hypothetical protein